MSEYGNVILTQKGMDFITSAHNKGIYIDLRYFVPAYDNRIDSDVRLSGYNLSSFSQVASEIRTSNNPVGEILWKRTNQYSLDISNKFIISASSFTGGQLQGSFQKATIPTNFYLDKPISDQVSADSWSVSGGYGVYNFTANPAGIGVTGLGNGRPTSTCADWFSTGDYYPVYNTSAFGTLRGAWKCILNQLVVGNIRFNKILLYAVAVQQNDPNVSVDECLFGEAYIQNPVVISNLGTGFDNVEIDVQIDISGTSANFEQLFYSSSADYWSHSPGGLYYPNRIGVGSFEDNQASISATMHLRRARSSTGVPDNSVPVLRMDYDNSRFVSLDVSETPYDINSPFDDFMGATPDHLSGSDIIIKVANWENYEGGYSNAIAFRPKVPATVVLGTSAYPFRELTLNNKRYTGTYELPDRVDENKLKNIIPLRVTNEFANYAVSINDGQVYLGNSSGTSINVSDPFGIKLSGIGIEITDKPEVSGTLLNGSFKGGDLLRQSQNLLIYNTYSIDDDLENIYIFAGLYHNSNFTSVGGQSGATHKNIVNAIENESMFWSLGISNDKLSSYANIDIAAKGRIGLFGPILLQNSNDGGFQTTVIASFGESYQSGQLRTFIGAGLSGIDINNFSEDISEKVYNIEELGELQDFTDITSLGSRLYLVANQIRIDGNAEGNNYPGIIPVRDAKITIGTSEKRLAQVNTELIKIGDIAGKKGLNIYSSYLNEGATIGIIKQDEAIAQIGQEEEKSRIDYGYFKNLYVNSFSARNIEGNKIQTNYKNFNTFSPSTATNYFVKWAGACFSTPSLDFYYNLVKIVTSEKVGIVTVNITLNAEKDQDHYFTPGSNDSIVCILNLNTLMDGVDFNKIIWQRNDNDLCQRVIGHWYDLGESYYQSTNLNEKRALSLRQGHFIGGIYLNNVEKLLSIKIDNDFEYNSSDFNSYTSNLEKISRSNGNGFGASFFMDFTVRGYIFP